MRKFVILCVAFFLAFSSWHDINGQTVVRTNAKANLTPLETVAQKRTQRMKEELFLSLDQTNQIMNINVDMLKKLDNLDKKSLDKTEHKKQLTLIENSTKNKIVSILTPAQRQRFESALFTEIYQTRVDKKKAVTRK
jgi:hypothetical protein